MLHCRRASPASAAIAASKWSKRWTSRRRISMSRPPSRLPLSRACADTYILFPDPFETRTMTELAVGGRSAAEYVRGAFYGLAAVSIWSGWIVVARLGLKSSLTPWDIAALRFGVAGLLLLPYVMSKGLALGRLGWIGLT